MCAGLEGLASDLYERHTQFVLDARHACHTRQVTTHFHILVRDDGLEGDVPDETVMKQIRVSPFGCGVRRGLRPACQPRLQPLSAKRAGHRADLGESSWVSLQLFGRHVCVCSSLAGPV